MEDYQLEYDKEDTDTSSICIRCGRTGHCSADCTWEEDMNDE